MGKGGEKSVTVEKNEKKQLSASAETRHNKLSKLSTEELRKWSVSYGLCKKGEEEDREVLLNELVSFIFYAISFEN
jgi:hypothetical protein